MLSVRDLVRRYAGRTVLDIPTFELPAGSVTALVGPNGSGKSTLLRILAAIERPDRGVLALDDRPVRTAADRRAARRAVTLVEQHPLLFDLAVQANLRDALRLHGDSGADADTRVAEALALVGAAELSHRRARTLSGGETQRVAIARRATLWPTRSGCCGIGERPCVSPHTCSKTRTAGPRVCSRSWRAASRA